MKSLLIIASLLGHVSLFAQNNLYDYDVEQRLDDLGIELIDLKLPPGINIEPAVRSGNLVYLSGNGPITSDGKRIAGKVGKDLTIEQGYDAARLTAIRHLSVLKKEIGDLNRVVKIVKVLGLVNAPPDFTEHPKVINGYTDLMIEVFGQRGKHARSAMGMGSLPWNLACEIEVIVEVKE
ncbi:MAG: RidA family protein [Cyclobacteriaceae bacterium]